MKTKLTPYHSIIVFISQLKFKLIVIFLIFNSIASTAQTCNADISVFKNRKSRSTSNSGTYFKMVITNKGLNNDIYNLTSLNINSVCNNSDNSDTASNVILNISFVDINLNPITTISVKKGESITFFVHVTVPIGTPFNRWCCTQIIATSSLCSNFKVDTSIHTLVINSNDD